MEDEVDAALDTELTASFLKNPAQGALSAEESCADLPCSSSTSLPAARLSFAFPDWDIDISRDTKRRKVSIVRHATQGACTAADAGKSEIMPAACGAKRMTWKLDCCADSRVWKLEEIKRGTLDFETEADVGNMQVVKEGDAEVGLHLESTTSCSDLPIEVLNIIWRRLSVRALCSAAQTCRRWHKISLHNVLWNSKVNPDFLFINSLDKACPRWITVKNMTLSEKFYREYGNYYTFLRRGMNSIWDLGEACAPYNSGIFHTMLKRLTVNNWSLLYEAFDAAFVDRTDCMANWLLAQFGSRGGLICGEAKQRRQQTALVSNSLRGESIELLSLDQPVADPQQYYSFLGPAGICLWKAVETLWRRYKSWLTLLSSLCPELNHEVMAERARSHASVSTPTLYEKGVICFRSQIVLRYGIRGALQDGITFLTAQEAVDSASDEDVELLRHVSHLLQELDVPDDLTLSPNYYTQDKLRRCFCRDQRKIQKLELSALVRGDSFLAR